MSGGRCPHMFLPPLCPECHADMADGERLEALEQLEDFSRVKSENPLSYRYKPKHAPKFDLDGRRRHSGFVDMTGERIGRVVVVRESTKPGTNSAVRWVCRCDCGREFEKDGIALRSVIRESDQRKTPYTCPECRPKRPGMVKRKTKE